MKAISQQNFSKDAKPNDVLEHILKTYTSPSFGSLSKRDVDILIFYALQDLGIIDKNPKIYDVVQLLHVTRSKARNLIYESALRRQDVVEMEKNLEAELKRVIVKPIFLSEGDKICIEIDNLLLTDYIRDRLRNLGHLTDGSFFPELVKMTPSAFSDLYVDLLPDESTKGIEKKFINLGLKKDKSPKALVKNVLIAICKGAMGRAGEELADYALDVAGTLGEWIGGKFDDIPKDKNNIGGTIYEKINIV